MEGVLSQDKDKKVESICFRDIKNVVSKEFERLEVF